MFQQERPSYGDRFKRKTNIDKLKCAGSKINKMSKYQKQHLKSSPFLFASPIHRGVRCKTDVRSLIEPGSQTVLDQHSISNQETKIMMCLRLSSKSRIRPL